MTRLVYLALTTLAYAAMLPAAVQCQQPPPQGVSVVHTPLKPEKLLATAPGQPLTLTVSLANTRNLDYKLRVAVVSDGRYLDVTPPEAKPDMEDRPTWTIELSAPLAELVYQFIFTSPKGGTAASGRYAMRRSCLPNIELADISEHPEIAGYERLQKMYSESKNLEADIAGFERAVVLLGELQKAINQ